MEKIRCKEMKRTDYMDRATYREKRSEILDKYEKKIWQNWERMKKESPFLNYFYNLYNRYYAPKNYRKEINGIFDDLDREELRKNLKLLHNHKFALISTDQDILLPSKIMDAMGWILGWEGWYGHYIYTLGVLLVHHKKYDLLKILADTGDNKAKKKKIRTKLPKELLGKELEFLQLNDKEWLITVKDEITTTCEYEKIYEEWFKDGREK